MKHLGRWMICLGLILNPIAFIALIVLGFTINIKILIASIACYPIAIMLIFSAKKAINPKCTLYRTVHYWGQARDPMWWMITKTILMPITSAGALFTFHLLSNTYRDTNEAIEDKTGFSISSIFRTFFAGFLFYVIWLLAHNFIMENIFGINSSIQVLIASAIVWLVSHILWDVLDFADKESDLFIFIKNIIFVLLTIATVGWGIWGFVNYFNRELTLNNMFILSSITLIPLFIHLVYYIIIRTERPPQSKMTFFWGPIALIVGYGLAYLTAMAAAKGRAWAIVIYLLVLAIYVLVMVLLKPPFHYKDGQYRLDYREAAKEKRRNVLREAELKETDKDLILDEYRTPNPKNDSKIESVAIKIMDKFNIKTKYIYISPTASFNGMALRIKKATKTEITYVIYGILHIEAKDETIDKIDNTILPEAKKRLMSSCNEKGAKIIEDTLSELKKANINFNGNINIDIKYASKII